MPAGPGWTCGRGGCEMAVLRLPQVDADALRDVVRDLSRDLDRSRLTALRDDLSRPRPAYRGRPATRVCPPGPARAPGTCGGSSIDWSGTCPTSGRHIGRPARRAAFVLPTITPTVVLGAVALMAGAALGGVLAWLYQPGVGVQRRKARPPPAAPAPAEDPAHPLRAGAEGVRLAGRSGRRGPGRLGPPRRGRHLPSPPGRVAVAC